MKDSKVIFGLIPLLGQVLLLLSASTVIAEGNEDNIFGLFEFVCLAQINNTQNIPSIITAMGAIELPHEEASHFLAPQNGRAWALLSNTEPGKVDSIITVSEQNVCGVSSVESVGKTVLSTFKANTRYLEIDTTTRGSQIEHTFSISRPDSAGGPELHAVVLITTTNLFQGKGVFLNSFSEDSLRINGADLPRWP